MFVNTFFCLLCRQLDADKKLLSLYLKEFSKLLLSNTTSHLHVHFVTLVFYLKASIFKFFFLLLKQIMKLPKLCELSMSY